MDCSDKNTFFLSSLQSTLQSVSETAGGVQREEIG